ncbi:growth arrest and DNA damage-inducible protein GADD45 beta-like [Physella acuta]|uniref:growth arrest and DNA damage-inducible protein GADD45 beta-like n=1 Tax=Physella acuta TaxID=109671 RepID=UPI0027DE8730|nr:growth arrest and DNA damage-inducible protein GADD45 beta-like [Physella acuta]
MYTETQIQCALCMSADISLSKLSEDLGEQSDPTGEKTQKTWLTISEALAITLKQALQQKRVTMGVHDCAKLLRCSPNRVMMCVLPELTTDDLSMHIHHTLVKSFCWEHEIKLLMVKNEQCLLDLVKGCPEHANATEKSVSCLMIEYPLDGNSEADTFVIGYHDTIMYSDIFPKPVIQLPE